MQSLDNESQENLQFSRSSSSSNVNDNDEVGGAEGEFSEGKLSTIPSDAFRRVYEFGDEQCILRRKADDDGPFIHGSDVFDNFSVRRTWICQLDQDVNLRTLLKLPQGYYTINWIFGYRLTSGSRSGAGGVQVYNCSFGKPLDAAMFWARVHDPSQPFISTNLNAIINPRTTMQLRVPEYETIRLSDSSEDLVLKMKSEGHTVVAGRQMLQVDWDGPTAFLIKLVSQRSLEGRLWFLGALLEKHDPQDLDIYQNTEVR